MKNRFRFPKWTVTAITVLLVILIIVTFILKQNNPDWQFGDAFLLTQAIALVIQLVLNGINWRSNKKIVILTTLFISATVMASIIWQFISYNLVFN
ncbi:hypothetical protein [Marixanthomonas spongiae]|uniref:Uncharacterized protein n=1 Tax=Marixanthomonas spongiae TaxID=2174845 RepID=A0A2U0I5I5_9FLAO|nr:hypothetical protein [Marixanthomonas spongiae]PVW16371.1 hypothetical protein DDV96_03685 [Marixanthomonas spongiae]